MTLIFRKTTLMLPTAKVDNCKIHLHAKTSTALQTAAPTTVFHIKELQLMGFKVYKFNVMALILYRR